jgi:fructokinase
MDEINEIDKEHFSIIHFGSATGFLPGPLQSAYLGLLNKVASSKTFISFDPNYRHLLFQHNLSSFIEQSWVFLNQCHFFKLSDEEAMLLTKTTTLEDAAFQLQERTKGVFAITLGKDGTYLRHGSHTMIIPSIPIAPVDTTGAGDAFVGAVLFQLSRLDEDSMHGLSVDEWQKIVVNSNKAGARTCEYLGAMEAFKHLSNQIFQ